MSQVGATDSQPGCEFSHFFEVQLDLFSGPIDLLLHLVKQNELPIEKLSLSQVAEQYLRCIEDMRAFDIDVAGEYLVIAATLVSVKSSLLLNEPVQLVEDEEGNLVDPHEELLRRLREAEVYRAGADSLGRKPFLGIDVFANPGTLHGVDAPPPRYKPHDAILLGVAFKKLLDRAGSQEPMTISMEEISIVDQMMGIVSELERAQRALPFEAFVKERNSRMAIIASFVALLELCKRQVIVVKQDEIGQEIVIALTSSAAAQALLESKLESEFDSTLEQSGVVNQ